MAEDWRSRLREALRLYVLTDPVLSGGRPDTDVVAEAIAGGATAIQLRWKSGKISDALAVGRALRQLCADAGVLFIVNDRVDLALALRADGIHVGEHDLPVAETRALVGRAMIVGFSPPTLVEAIQAERQGADYLGIGPIFATSTKPDAGGPVGLKRIHDVARSVALPFVGIGGVSLTNAASVVEAGADGVAVISAVVGARDVTEAARGLRQAVDAGLAVRERRPA